MGYEPLFSASESPKLCTGHEKHAPSLKPPLHLGRAIDLSEKALDLLCLRIHSAQPSLSRLLVVYAAHPPVFIQNQVVLKTKQQVV